MRPTIIKARRFLFPIACRDITTRAPSDLHSFLEHSVDKDRSSTVYRGTLFEWQTREAFQRHLGMRLLRVGGKNDGGIDLRGHWPLRLLKAVKLGTQTEIVLPDIQPHIIAQCKNRKSGCTPNHLRSLIGAVINNDPTLKETIGILATVASGRQFTRDVLSQFMGSQIPLGLAQIHDAQLQSLVFNPAAEAILKGLTVVPHHDLHNNNTKPVMSFDGYILELVDDDRP